MCVTYVCIHNAHKDFYSCAQSMCLVRGWVTTENYCGLILHVNKNIREYKIHK